jgi:orotate phosphoribosyltransferase
MNILIIFVAMQSLENTASKIAEYLLQINAIKLNTQQPYTWASGWKSPIYSDNRLILSHPEIRNYVKLAMASLIQEKFSGVQAIIGVATAGIAPGALVADVLNLPFGYVRSEAKKHGMGKQIEGDIIAGTKIVVVEDLVSTGRSSLQAIEAVRAAGCEVLGLACIFTYAFNIAQQNFNHANVAYYALSNYTVLVQSALNKAKIKPDEVAVLNSWRENPESWGL